MAELNIQPLKKWSVVLLFVLEGVSMLLNTWNLRKIHGPMLLNCGLDRTTQGNDRWYMVYSWENSTVPFTVSPPYHLVHNLESRQLTRCCMEPGGKHRRCPQCEETKCLASINKPMSHKYIKIPTFHILFCCVAFIVESTSAWFIFEKYIDTVNTLCEHSRKCLSVYVYPSLGQLWGCFAICCPLWKNVAEIHTLDVYVHINLGKESVTISMGGR